MTSQDPQKLLIVGVGGLGAQMVREALERAAQVSVLVRDRSKLDARLGDDVVSGLAGITIGDATDPSVLDSAMQGIDVVLSGNGAHPQMAHELASAVRRNDVQKLCWPAGGTNVTSEDGVTPAYRDYVDQWPGAADAYRAHQACIDAIREVGINYVILCPGRMESTGHRSSEDSRTVRVNRPTGMFTSYEDAAWVMLEGALTDAFDRELVSVATSRDRQA